jgi:hypothetical protein
VEPQRVGDYLDDSLVADLIAVTERAVDDVAPPVLSQTLNVRELVNQAGGGNNPASNDGVATGELHAEVAVVSPAHATREAGDDLAAVAADFFTSDRDQLRRGQPFAGQVAMQMPGRAVARLSGIDDDHRPALAPKLKRGGKSGG